MGAGTIVAIVSQLILALVLIVKIVKIEKLKERFEEHRQFDSVEWAEAFDEINKLKKRLDEKPKDSPTVTRTPISKVTPELLWAHCVDTTMQLPRDVRDMLPEDELNANKSIKELLNEGGVEIGYEEGV